MDSAQKKVYIIGNWKMNPVSFEESEMIFDNVKASLSYSEKVEVVVCPPSIFLSKLVSDNNIKLGVQNIFWESSGSFTGEISAKMVKAFGADFAIIGHSERRYYLGENDAMVNLKIKASIKNSIKPILCVGETLEQRDRGDMENIIIKQIQGALSDVNEKDIAGKLIIAYEPVWAIGTGQIPSNDDIMSVGLLIRKVLNKLYGNRDLSDNTPILYGGSVNSQNSFDILDKTGLHGLLIGGASLKSQEFVEIIRKFS